MSLRRFGNYLLVAFIAAFVFGRTPALGQDQTTSSTLDGTITDPSGAVVPGAVVTLIGIENGVTRTFPTTESGSYSFRLLPPATYSSRWTPLVSDRISRTESYLRPDRT